MTVQEQELERINRVREMEKTERNDVANARLIAAAPELLAACYDAYHYCQGMLASQRSGQIDDGIIRQLLKEKLRAAIAKAEGQ